MQNPNISPLHMTAILISTTIGVGLLAVPRFAVQTAGTGAPLVTMAGTLVVLLSLLIVTILGLRFPSKSLPQYSEDILGRALTLTTGMIIVTFFTLLNALVSREFGEVVVTSVLRNTPIQVTVLVMLLLAALSSRYDVDTFSRIHMFYIPFILAPSLVIIMLSFKNTRFLNLLPLLGNNHHHLFSGILSISALFQGSFILSLMIPYLRERKKVYGVMLWGWAVPSGLYVLIVIAAIGVFGTQEIKLMMWPTLELAKATAFPGNILERADAAILAVWVANVFATLFSGYFAIVNVIAQLFCMRNHQMFTFFLLPFIFIMAMLPQNIFQVYEIIEIIGKIGLIITLAYPAALLLIAVLRGKSDIPKMRTK